MTVTYRPFDALITRELSEGSQLSSGNVSQIAEGLFQSFVNATTDDKLQKEAFSIIAQVRLFSLEHKVVTMARDNRDCQR